jgi:hypothetical protein
MQAGTSSGPRGDGIFRISSSLASVSFVTLCLCPCAFVYMVFYFSIYKTVYMKLKCMNLPATSLFSQGYVSENYMYCCTKPQFICFLCIAFYCRMYDNLLIHFLLDGFLLFWMFSYVKLI